MKKICLKISLILFALVSFSAIISMEKSQVTDASSQRSIKVGSWRDEDEQGFPIYDCQCKISNDRYVYDGKPHTPDVTVASGSAVTVPLVQNVDYTVTYEQNQNYGVGRVIIEGKGNYCGYRIFKFGIVPKKPKKVKVKSPHSMEATVTWNKVEGADGFYVYRKAAGGKLTFVANITDGNYQVFHDKNKALKKGKKYTYQIVPYVIDYNYDENTEGAGTYQKPSSKKSEYLLYDAYKNTRSYYGYNYYDYSCIKGKCVNAFEGDPSSLASGKVTKSKSGKRYARYSGSAEADYMAYLINKKVVKKGMGENARVSAIFNWMVKNCTFTKDVKDYSKLKKMKCYFKYYKAANRKKCQAYEGKIMKQIYQGKALCTGDVSDRAVDALAYHKGSCSYLTPMFNILCNQAGVEAYLVDGNYVNRDGSKMYHNWSFVKIGKKYYWYDVPVACRNKSVKNTWYKKGTKFWKTCHQWSKSKTKGYNDATFQK